MKILIQLYQRIGVQTIVFRAEKYLLPAIYGPSRSTNLETFFVIRVYLNNPLRYLLLSSDSYRKRTKQGIFIAIC